MMKFIPFVLIFLVGCTTSSKDELTKREQWVLMAQKPSAVSGAVKARDGKVTEFIFTQESNMQVVMVTNRSEKAVACQEYARRKPAETVWIWSCDAALAEPNLDLHNRSVNQFNRALILGNLGEVTEAKQSLSAIIKDNPQFYEADYELARLDYLAGHFSSAKKYAQTAIEKKMRAPSRAYYIIGQAFERDFEFQEAREAYEAGLEQNKEASNLRRSLNRLNRLWPA